MKTIYKLNTIGLMMMIAITASAVERFETLSLSQAVNHTLEHHLELSAIESQIEMSEAQMQQAGLFPNPVLSGGMEAITPDTDRNNPQNREDIIGFTQAIPLGGALQKSVRVFELEREQQEAEGEALKIELTSKTKSAFYEVIYYQETIYQLGTLQTVLDDLLTISKTRFEQGDIPAVEVIRAEAGHKRFAIQSSTARSQLANAKTRLAGLMGDPNLFIGECQGSLEPDDINLSYQDFISTAGQHPRAQAWQKQEAVAAAEIEKAEAEAFPQLEIGANYRRIEESSQDTFDFSIGISIPIFNRNQGAIRYQKENLERHKTLIALQKNSLNEAVKITLENIAIHQEHVNQFQISILPKMIEASQISQTAYSEGDVSILEVLDAHRNLAESQLTYLEELIELKKSVIQLETLIGTGF